MFGDFFAAVGEDFFQVVADEGVDDDVAEYAEWDHINGAFADEGATVFFYKLM